MEKLFFFVNTMGHNELHKHAASEHFLQPLFPALAIEKNGEEKKSTLKKPDPSTSEGKLVLMGLPSLFSDNPREGWFCRLEKADHVSSSRS